MFRRLPICTVHIIEVDRNVVRCSYRDYRIPHKVEIHTTAKGKVKGKFMHMSNNHPLNNMVCLRVTVGFRDMVGLDKFTEGVRKLVLRYSLG